MTNMLFQSYYRARIAKLLNSRKGELRLRYHFAPNIKAIYVCNPKVAGSTIMRSLASADNPDVLTRYDNLSTMEARADISSEKNLKPVWAAMNDPDFFKFTFVRNPYTRCVSCYRDKMSESSPIRYRDSLDLPAKGDISLNEFLSAISKQKSDAMNRHWRPQSELIPQSFKLDFIGRFESLVEDLTYVLDHLGIEGDSIKALDHHSTGVGTTVLDEISVREIAAINKIYAEDFARFGYEMLA